MKNTLLIVALAGLAALMLGGAVAGSALDIWPEFNLRLVEHVVCPPEQTLEYRELGLVTYTDSDGTHNVENISISCITGDGTRIQGKGTATIGALFGLYSMLLFLPLLAAGFLFRRYLVRRNPRAAGPTRR